MAQIREELVLYDRFTNTFTSYIRQAERASGATTATRNATEQFTKSQRTAARAADGLTGSLRNLIGGLITIQGLKSALNLSDTLASTKARLDMMNDGLQTTAELQNMIFQSAQRSRGLYTETAAFVAKLGNLAGNAFSSNAEIVAFAEQINKQIALSGATSTEASAAILQLTQGLSSGALRGEELNSVLEQTPMIAKTIADYMGVTTGEMRTLASEGKVTAEVVKNAMFAAAEETNAKFESMPRTWGQVWNQLQNQAIQALQPLFDALSDLADSQFVENAVNGITLALRGVGAAAKFVADNIEWLGPIVATAAAAFIGYKVAVGLATTAQNLLNAAMMANPIGLVVAVVIALIAAFIWLWDTCEGFRDFWVDFVSRSATQWMHFYNDVWVPVANGLSTLLRQTGIMFQDLARLIVNAFADAAIAVVENFDVMLGGVRGAMKMYNAIAGALGGPTIDIDYALSTEGINATRSKALAAIDSWRIPGFEDIKPIDEEKFLANMQSGADFARKFNIGDFVSGALQSVTGEASNWLSELANGMEAAGDDLGAITDGVKSIEKAVNMTDEDIRSLVDVAERRYVSNVNLTAQTPVITVNGANTGHTAADRQNLANAIRDILVEQRAAGSTRSTVRPTMG